ncbi:MAG TPA: protoporphyrinogen oxidase [Vicinamibacterales bacterium]|nr:protoporphyrinogen oxidase [Vicinamibacterales bacterium]
MTPPRVVVVGGGITGLSLAFTLQEDARRAGAPLSLTVLDAAPRIGGHAHTTASNGFLIETGPNGFLNREPHTRALIEALGLWPRVIEARPEAERRFILTAGRLCAVPGSPVALLTSSALSWRGKVRLLAEPLARGPSAGVDETVFEFATRRIGREAAEILVDTAVSGISAGDSRRLSVGAQFPLMVEMEREHGSLIRAMIARRRAGRGAPKLLSFDAGLSTLTDALGERLGPALWTSAPVRSLERAGAAWRVAVHDGRALEADHVVLAAPARAAATVVARLDPALAALLGSIEYAGIAVVALGYRLDDVRRPLDGYGYLVTRAEQMATLGVAWESSLFAGRAPEGMALFRAFLGGSRRPEVLDLTPPQLVETARNELARVLDLRGAPRHTWVFGWPDAIAQYTVGHRERRARILDRLEQHTGLSVCGTSYDGVSINDAIRSGRTLARSLAESLWSGGGGRAVAPESLTVGA